MELDEEHQPTQPHVQNLWFDEGGIIVKAGTSLFRVSRGILVMQSPIFADTFRIPQPADAETMDGCAVVELPDAPEDVSVFLKAILDSSCVILRTIERQSLIASQVFRSLPRADDVRDHCRRLTP